MPAAPELGALTSRDVHGAAAVAVPVGSLEQHGPHLPLDTDTRIATAVARGIAEELGYLLAPAVAYGASGEHQEFPGTVSIGTAALSTVLVEYGRSVCEWASRVVFVNGHGGNVDALRAAVAMLRAENRDVVWCSGWAAGGDAHAGHTETSLLLHLSPHLVRRDRWVAGNRQSLDALLPAAAPSRTRQDVVLAWQFSIAHGPFAAFDLAAARTPFPTDALIDPATDRVSLPPGWLGADVKAASLYAGLDRLDGFSTTAGATVPIDVADDTANAAPMGAIPGTSAFLVNATTRTLPPAFTVQPERTNGDWDGLLVLTPTQPLRPDRTAYIGALTDGVKDTRGRPLRPSLPMRLLLMRASLLDDHGRSALPGVLADADATRLEAIRMDLVRQGVWQVLEAPPLSLARERIAALWSFRTQSMTQALVDVAAWPAAKMLPVEVQILDAADSAGALGPDVGQVVSGTMRTHLALTNGGAPGGTLDLAGAGRDTDVPFLFIAPASGQAHGVAIVQHGFGGFRGDIRPFAQAAAKAGWAIIGIDIVFHGARAACTKDAECDGGGACRADGTCSTSLAVRCTDDSQCDGGKAGSCDGKTGRCASGFAPESALCITHSEKGAPVTECNPVAGGAAFLNLADPFALRDNLRQHVLDLAQLVRVVELERPLDRHADERIVAVLESNAIEAAILAQAVGVGAGCVYALRGQFASLSLNSLSRLSSRNESPTLGEWEVHWRNAAGQDIRVDRGTLTVEDRGMGFVPFEVRLTAPDGFCVVRTEVSPIDGATIRYVAPRPTWRLG